MEANAMHTSEDFLDGYAEYGVEVAMLTFTAHLSHPKMRKATDIAVASYVAEIAGEIWTARCSVLIAPILTTTSIAPVFEIHSTKGHIIHDVMSCMAARMENQHDIP
jgi:hypothetical protein